MDDQYEDIIFQASQSRGISEDQIEFRASVDHKFYSQIESEYTGSMTSRLEDMWNGENRE